MTSGRLLLAAVLSMAGRVKPLRWLATGLLAAVGVQAPWLRAEHAPTRPTTVPADWEPRYTGYVSHADTMVRLLGITAEQRRVARDRLLLMTYEMEQWEEREGQEARRLEADFHRIDARQDPKGKQVAFYAWDAALAPQHAIRDEHLSWIAENVLTSEQRVAWSAHDLGVSVSVWLHANGVLSEGQTAAAKRIAREVTEEIPGKYYDAKVQEARRRRLIGWIKAEVLTTEQASKLEALLRLRDDARKEYEASTTQPVATPIEPLRSLSD